MDASATTEDRRVVVVVPLPGDTASLEALANRLIAVTPDDLYEVVFVDIDAPSPVTELVESFGGDVSVVAASSADPSTVLRAAVSVSESPLMAFLDCRAQLTEGWLQAAVQEIGDRDLLKLTALGEGNVLVHKRVFLRDVTDLPALPDIAPLVQNLWNVLHQNPPLADDSLPRMQAAEFLRERLAMDEERRQLVVARRGRDVCWTEDEDDMEPLITVRMATYDRGQSVVDTAIASVIAQTYENWEMVVVGDHCDEKTERAVRGVSDRRIHFVNLPTRGVYPRDPWLRWLTAGSPAVNFALQVAEGAWIAPIDDDDEFTPDHLEVLLRDAKARRLEMVWSKAEMEIQPGTWNVIGKEPFYNNVSHGTVMYSAGLRFLKMSETSWRMLEPADQNMWRRMEALGVKMGFVDQITYRHYLEGRYREGSVGPQEMA